jgi:hypothetical protein
LRVYSDFTTPFEKIQDVDNIISSDLNEEEEEEKVESKTQLIC